MNWARSIVFGWAVWASAPSLFAAGPAQPLRGFLDQHCIGCHGADSPEAGLDLTQLAWQFSDGANFEAWVKVHDRVAKGEMPPAGEPRPPQELRDKSLSVLHTALKAENLARQQARGRVGLRRLNRVEYENTLHDLLDIDVRLKEILPEDAPLDGFDTVSEGLRISPLHLEKYLEAADVALDAAVRLTQRPETKKQMFPYKEQEGVRKHLDGARTTLHELPHAVVLFTDASYITKVHGLNVQHTGHYRIRARAAAYQSQKPVVLRLYAGSYRQGTTRLLGYFDMPPGEAREVEVVARLEEAEYLYPAPDDLEADPEGKNVYGVGGKNFGGSGLALEWIEVEGPLVETWPPSSVSKLFGSLPVEPLPPNPRQRWDRRAPAFHVVADNPKSDARAALTAFAARAFRRPLESGEVDRYVGLVHRGLDDKLSFDEAMRIGFRAVLTSPQFLFLEERPGRLDDDALASRLSYFLWSTMPDEELLRLAARGELTGSGGRSLKSGTGVREHGGAGEAESKASRVPNSSPTLPHPRTPAPATSPATGSTILHSQVERLLNHANARAFTENFVGQWLQLRNIDATAPDMRLYPEFDELLKLSMVRETEEFFAEILREDLPVANFIHSDFAMLNRRLATHYGIAGVAGEQFRKVSLPADSHRGGVLTQASVLKVTANGTVTSPVLRGAWVMDHLLGQPPQPPPADVGAIEPDTRGATTVREQLAKHRDVESCASCHKSIDPPGFALESFDVIGGWRERYRSQEKGDRPDYTLRGRRIHEYRLGPAVDCTGELADGRKFAGIDDFKRLLLEQREQVARALVEHLITYGTGASVQFADREVVEAILQKSQPTSHGLRTLIHEIVESSVFQTK